MAKLIAFDQEAREGIQRGVDTLADAVKVTLGPVSYTHLTLPTKRIV